MYTLVMSLIHDEYRAARHDSDSDVPGIPTIAVGMRAFADYLTRLEVDYGVTFERNEGSEHVVVAAFAPMDSAYGSATIYVELQVSRTRHDPSEIVDLMRVRAHHTRVC